MDVRQAAVESAIKILDKKILFDDALKPYENKVFSKAELHSLVAGTIKLKLRLDFVIEKITNRKLKDISFQVKNILRLAIYELEQTQNPEYAVINSYVELTKKYNPKASGFTNGALRAYLRKKNDIEFPSLKKNPAKAISIIYSHPEWMVKNWIKNYGQDKTIQICEFNNKSPKLTIRPNYIKISKQELIEFFELNNIKHALDTTVSECIELLEYGDIRNIAGFKEGLWLVQGESSILTGKILDPQPGENILDLCSAPGGKTAHIAALMQNKGRITAVDISETRLKKVNENCTRLGINIVKTVAADATTFFSDEKFDRILIDAPCSNTGVLAKRADARWNRRPEDVIALSEIQKKILDNAVNLLKKGGCIVYSTCSIEPEENTMVTDQFVTKNKAFCYEDITKYLPWKSTTIGYTQITQSIHGIDGFYIAKIVNKES